MGSFLRQRRALQAAWISVHRSFRAPALVNPVIRLRSLLEFSPGTRPTYDSSAWLLGKRSTWSTAPAKRTAVT